MDLVQLREERERLAEEFRSVMTSLSLLRALHQDARMMMFGVSFSRSSKSSPIRRARLEPDWLITTPPSSR